jgi:DNA-directed RNA polymerase subunit RPC12/RpoP
MQIKDIYKQPLLLCRACRSLLSYQSFILENDPNDNCVVITTMVNVKADEILVDSTEYLGLSCPICSYTIGVKYVSFLPFFLQK